MDNEPDNEMDVVISSGGTELFRGKANIWFDMQEPPALSRWGGSFQADGMIDLNPRIQKITSEDERTAEIGIVNQDSNDEGFLVSFNGGEFD